MYAEVEQVKEGLETIACFDFKNGITVMHRFHFLPPRVKLTRGVKSPYKGFEAENMELDLPQTLTW